MKFDVLTPQVISEQGRQSVQEDTTFPVQGKASIHQRLFVVCDGMGGKGKGDVASSVVTKTVSDYFFQNTCPDEPLTNDMLRMALVMAYEQLGTNCPDNVGTTLAMLYMHRKGCTAVHIGDSRIYQFRPSAHAIIYKSTDDFKEMLAHSSNPVSPEVALLTNVQPGDYFLVCTKSLIAHLTDAQIIAMICGEGNDEWKRQLLRERSQQVEDNHSGVLVQVSGVMVETTDHQPIQKQIVQPVARRPKPRVAEPARPAAVVPEDDEPDKRKFPVIAVTAAVMVLLAGLLYWWVTREKVHEEPVPVVVEKPDTLKKEDNMKIVDTSSEVKRDTTKTQTVQTPAYRQQADSLLNAISASEQPATGDDNSSSSSENATAQPQNTDAGNVSSPTPATTEPEPSATPATTTPPANNGNGVTPRPVIPEE